MFLCEPLQPGEDEELATSKCLAHARGAHTTVHPCVDLLRSCDWAEKCTFGPDNVEETKVEWRTGMVILLKVGDTCIVVL